MGDRTKFPERARRVAAGCLPKDELVKLQQRLAAPCRDNFGDGQGLWVGGDESSPQSSRC